MDTELKSYYVIVMVRVMGSIGEFFSREFVVQVGAPYTRMRIRHMAIDMAHEQGYEVNTVGVISGHKLVD